MLVRFKHVGEGSDEWDSTPIRFGEGDDEHVAICAMKTFEFYEQAFREDPRSLHKSLVDDINNDAGDLGFNLSADSRAFWAMLRVADMAGLNDSVAPVETDYDEFVNAHIVDDIDLFHRHYLINKEVDASFPSISAFYDSVNRQSSGRKRKR